MFKRFFALSILIIGLLVAGCNGATPTPTPRPTPTTGPESSPTPTPETEGQTETIVLTMGGWYRLEPLLEQVQAQQPDLAIRYEFVPPAEYDDWLQAQLEAGSAPDLVMLPPDRPALAERIEPLSDLPGLRQNFSLSALDSWSDEAGVPYGVPLGAVSHGVYYNATLFNELGLTIPNNWTELLDTARRLQEAGRIPFANGSGEAHTVADQLVRGMAPNFIGGPEGRLAYLAGERCFNDEHIVALFRAIQDLAAYLPENADTISQADSRHLFASGRAAMWLASSDQIASLESESPAFPWSVFALPAPGNASTFMTLQPEAAIGLNAASEQKEIARLFLEWMTTADFAALLGETQPGLFSLQTTVPPLSSEPAQTFLTLMQAEELAIHRPWAGLQSGQPTGYSLMEQGAAGVIRGEMSPRQAADTLQQGLAQWFEPAQSCGSQPQPTTVAGAGETSQTITLRLASWQVDEVEQMNRLLQRFQVEYPHITIELEPILPAEYDAALRTQLEAGLAPDLFYLRPFARSERLYGDGFVEPLTDLPGLSETFSPTALEAWSAETGVPYGLPFIGVSHAVYYNVDIFNRLRMQPPSTWLVLLDTAQALQEIGFIPFANGSNEFTERVFVGLAPNFIGGRSGQLAYLAGERCFNDAQMVAAFQAVQDLRPYLPPDHQVLTYYDSQQLFVSGQAAMWVSGSWEIAYLESQNPDFAWSVFALPAPAGESQFIPLYPEAAIGLNPASEHKQAARLFLEWMTTVDFASLVANRMPGYFPLHSDPPPIPNESVQPFLALTQERSLITRPPWSGLPAEGYSLMQQSVSGVIQGGMEPSEAANALQEGLAQSFEPAQSCDQ